MIKQMLGLANKNWDRLGPEKGNSNRRGSKYFFFHFLLYAGGVEAGEEEVNVQVQNFSRNSADTLPAGPPKNRLLPPCNSRSKSNRLMWELPEDNESFSLKITSLRMGVRRGKSKEAARVVTSFRAKKEANSRLSMNF